MKRYTIEQLPQAVSELFERLEVLEKNMKDTDSASRKEKELMTITKAAKFLKLSVATLYLKISRWEVPVNKQGKRLYFYRLELLQWIRSGKRRTRSRHRFQR